MKSLLHLLWSDTGADGTSVSPVRPSQFPALGLPFRVAAFALAESLRRFTTAPNSGNPKLWSFADEHWPAMCRGRRAQLGMLPLVSEVTTVTSSVNLLRPPLSTRWPIPVHAAYGIPNSHPGTPPANFMAAWHHALQFITAVDGSESVLDQIFGQAPSAIKFGERWKLRSRLPMPTYMWTWFDEITRMARTGDFVLTNLAEITTALADEFSARPLMLPDEFLAERVDVELRNETSPEFPCTVMRRTTGAVPQPNPLPLQSITAEKLVVRMAQLTAKPDWAAYPSRFPKLRRAERMDIRRQVTQAFHSLPQTDPEWALAVFPEVCLPADDTTVRSFEKLVAETGKGGIIGCLWRELPMAQRGFVESDATRYLVNEALVALPIGTPGANRPRVRSFLVRKPLPTHVEIALAQRLTELATQSGAATRYEMLPGRRVYRFVHGQWGDFTVAICSDLLDPVPWASLRGQILHLFMPSYNKDVALFDSLTWVRAYENYVNVVATNHGEYGGSFAWSPKSGDSKELARIRGSGLLVLVDVELPVAALHERQQNGAQDAVIAGLEVWRGQPAQRTSFKAPPPGFSPRPMSV